jgi:hypothetical protein
VEVDIGYRMGGGRNWSVELRIYWSVEGWRMGDS